MVNVFYNFNFYDFVRHKAFSIMIIVLACSLDFFTSFQNLQFEPYNYEAYQYFNVHTHVLNFVRLTIGNNLQLFFDDDYEIKKLEKQFPIIPHHTRIHSIIRLKKQKYNSQKFITANWININTMRPSGIFLTSMRC